MKLIEAYIPPDALEQVRQVLLSQGLDDLVASDAAVEATDEYRTLWESFTADFVPQIKLEVAVSDDSATATAHKILNVVRQVLLSQGLDDLVASDAAVEATDEYRTLWESFTADFVPQVNLKWRSRMTAPPPRRIKSLTWCAQGARRATRRLSSAVSTRWCESKPASAVRRRCKDRS